MTTLAPEHFQRAANLVLTRHPGLMAMMKEVFMPLFHVTSFISRAFVANSLVMSSEYHSAGSGENGCLDSQAVTGFCSTMQQEHPEN